MSRDLQTIGKALAAIGGALQRLVPQLQQSTAVEPGATSRRRSKLKLTPERRAALKLQGQYMGYLRNLKPRQKTRIKTLRTTKGIRPAIAAAKKLATG